MLRILVCAALLVAPVALPVAPALAKASKPGERCDKDKAERRKSILGGVLGGLASTAIGGRSIGPISLPVDSMLTDAIVNLLDCKEQQQAAKATDEAVRGGVGTTSSWQSESRANVSGSSTVTGEEKLADGSQCLTVTDVVIVDGEETTVPKRMCRSPGGKGYVRV